MHRIRVLLVDDHNLVRAGLCSLLREQPEIEVAGDAADGRRGLALVQQLRPDVVLMDVSMAGLNGLEATRQIQRSCPEANVLILTRHSTQEHVYQALRAGASGFVVKQAAAEELVAAIHTVYQGKIFISPTICKHDVQVYIRRAQASEPPDSYAELTPREREVLQLIAEGHTAQSAASVLQISSKTVETHRAHLIAKLGIHTTAGLTRYAISRGIVDLD